MTQEIVVSGDEVVNALPVQQRDLNAVAHSIIETLTNKFNENVKPNGKAFLDGIPLDIFLNISDYTSNRNPEDRANKALKKDVSHLHGALEVPQQTEVKAIFITREHAPRTWARVAANCQNNNLPCTLPFVLEDGHTRKNAWSQKNVSKKGFDGWQLERPEEVDLLVYSLNIKGEPITDDDFFKMVEAECSKDTALTVGEINDMSKKEAGLTDLTSGYCSKSWSNPAGIYSAPNRSTAKDIRLLFAEGFNELDKLQLPYQAKTKTFGIATTPELKARFRGGIKAAVLSSFAIAKELGITVKEVVDGFWLEFYKPWVDEQESTTEGAVGELIEWIENPERKKHNTNVKIDSVSNTAFDLAVYTIASNKVRDWCTTLAASKKAAE